MFFLRWIAYIAIRGGGFPTDATVDYEAWFRREESPLNTDSFVTKSGCSGYFEGTEDALS